MQGAAFSLLLVYLAYLYNWSSALALSLKDHASKDPLEVVGDMQRRLLGGWMTVLIIFLLMLLADMFVVAPLRDDSAAAAADHHGFKLSGLSALRRDARQSGVAEAFRCLTYYDTLVWIVWTHLLSGAVGVVWLSSIRLGWGVPGRAARRQDDAVRGVYAFNLVLVTLLLAWLALH
jgi:hypothetical protein